MSRQVDVRENFYLVGYATDADLGSINYSGLQITGSLPGSLVVDGTIPPVAALVLIKDQTNQIQNGIYRVINNGTGPSIFRLDRVSDTFGFDKGKPIYALNGLNNYRTAWILDHPAEYIVVGVTPVTFLPLSPGSAPPPSSSKKTYTLSQFKTAAYSTNWTAIGEFQWNNIRYSSYVAGTVLTGTTVTGYNVNIRLRDVTNNVTLGQVLNVSTNGAITFPVANPIGDAVLQVQVSRLGTGGNSPFVHGATLEYIEP